MLFFGIGFSEFPAYANLHEVCLAPMRLHMNARGPIGIDVLSDAKTMVDGFAFHT
jgi:hypothetical protein